jgi:pilus assembly protein Flp/PilA
MLKLWKFTMSILLARLSKDDSGSTAIEYALIAAIIGIGIVAALIALRAQLNGTFSTVSNTLASENSA